MEAIKPVRVAVIGCGAISGIYFENMTRRFSILEVAACCDLNEKLAQAVSQRYHLPVMTMEEIMADESIELVVNLTPPAAHYGVIRALLEHGKHVYTEKVLCVQPEQARELAALAKEKGLLLCAAPDTFLGADIQTARAIVDSGIVGDITSCVAVLQRDAGLLAEKFPYTIAQGGGIGIDVGIYYATALLSILGPAAKVSGMSQTYQPERTHFFTSRGHFGEPYTIPHTHAYDGDDRGIGVAEMAWSLRKGRKPRTHSDLACHALEMLSGAVESGKTGTVYTMQTTLERPAALPRGYMGVEYGLSEPEAELAF